MATYKVARIEEFEELKPKLVKIGPKEVAVYMHKNCFFAYLNECPHQGGPACEGAVWGDLLCELASNKTIAKKYTSTDTYNIICPWHGLEFDLQTGIARGTICSDMKLTLRKINVSVEAGEVNIEVG